MSVIHWFWISYVVDVTISKILVIKNNKFKFKYEKIAESNLFICEFFALIKKKNIFSLIQAII